MTKKDDFELVQVRIEDTEIIKFIFLCHIDEEEKDKYSEYPANIGKIPYSEDGFNKFHDHFVKSIGSRFLYFVLKSKEECLGFIQVSSFNMRNHTAEIGFYFPKDKRKQGFGSVLLSKFLAEIFADDHYLKLNKVYGETCELNTASKKLFEKFAFKLDGIMREQYWFGEEKYDQHVYSLLRKEY
jgi:RimJ/RimL family protein N-acetyltransferase